MRYSAFTVAAILAIAARHAATPNIRAHTAAPAAVLQSEFLYDKPPFPSVPASTIVATRDALLEAMFGGARDGAIADSIDVKAYWQSNERALVNDIDINFGPVFPRAPDSVLAWNTTTTTRCASWAWRRTGSRSTAWFPNRTTTDRRSQPACRRTRNLRTPLRPRCVRRRSARLRSTAAGASGGTGRSRQSRVPC